MYRQLRVIHSVSDVRRYVSVRKDNKIALIFKDVLGIFCSFGHIEIRMPCEFYDHDSIFAKLWYFIRSREVLSQFYVDS